MNAKDRSLPPPRRDGIDPPGPDRTEPGEMKTWLSPAYGHHEREGDAEPTGGVRRRACPLPAITPATGDTDTSIHPLGRAIQQGSTAPRMKTTRRCPWRNRSITAPDTGHPDESVDLRQPRKSRFFEGRPPHQAAVNSPIHGERPWNQDHGRRVSLPPLPWPDDEIAPAGLSRGQPPGHFRQTRAPPWGRRRQAAAWRA